MDRYADKFGTSLRDRIPTHIPAISRMQSVARVRKSKSSVRRLHGALMFLIFLSHDDAVTTCTRDFERVLANDRPMRRHSKAMRSGRKYRSTGKQTGDYKV